MVRRSDDARPWGEIEFTRRHPRFGRVGGPEDGSTRPADWLASFDTLPGWVKAEVRPLVTTRNPCCAAHPNRPWLSREVWICGYGTLYVSGTASGDRPGVDLLTWGVPAGLALEPIARDEIKGPGPVRDADPADRAEWLYARLCHAVGALAAQLVRDTDDRDVTMCPLLNRHADRYTFRGGLVYACPGARLTLHDPASY